ncbi:sigma-54-dependent Fis family transcriptional regulator [Dyella ginsengisoli]|uniref:Sigma-54-dependent Fis family transcriptional regulator n=1 Tax=Dyella ginsengisoli TaxID=363848 RepID=A0ABW8JXD4_9GAMM
MQSGLVAARRCVIWFGQPSKCECDALAQSGWSIRRVHAMDGELRVRSGDIVVAMADLRDSDEAALDAMGELIAAHPRLIWLALVPPRMPAQRLRVERVLQASIDFFTAPVDLGRLIETLGTIAGGRPHVSAGDLDGIVGRSPAMQTTFSRLRKFAPVDLPVLITGETGTGKEGAAKALHQLSVRGGKPFVAINCGALPVNLVQSELFGHERGAFTGANARRIGHIESAAGGTVFLDEIGDLPLDAQTSLLRFLQEGTIERLGSSQSIRTDARVIAATHVDLEQAVAAGRFRQDLYYRLNVLRLSMPPLREREGDVELLAQHFLDRFREHHACRARAFSAGARAAMRRFAWPGNVRELINRVQRAAVVAEDALVSAADLDLPMPGNGASAIAALGVTRVAAEREAIVTCLRESRFNISECARRLRISRVTVYRLCKKHRLALDELR